MIKLFASDLDGTLLKGRNPDDPVYDIIERVLEQKKYFVIATGRLMYPEHIKAIKFDKYPVYIICMNGVLIRNPQKEIIFRKKINDPFLMNMFKEFPAVFFELIGEKSIYLKQTREEFIEHVLSSELRRSKLPRDNLFLFLKNFLFECNEKDILNEGILKINCNIDDPKENWRFREFLESNKESVVNSPFESNGIFELTDSTINKGHSLGYLIDKLKINKHEVAVYGDGENDLSMLSQFKNSYAPQNAIREAKRSAKEIIESCDAYGVPKHIHKILESQDTC